MANMHKYASQLGRLSPISMLLNGQLFRNRISLVKIGILISCAGSPLKFGILIQIFFHNIMYVVSGNWVRDTL